MQRLPVIAVTPLLATAGFLSVSLNHAVAAPVQPFLPTPPQIVSTTPANGDQNPYGVAFITSDFKTGGGPLEPGDILVSNFNNSKNLQGTGTTIVSVSPAGKTTLFFTTPHAVLGGPGTGLSTALGILREGFIIVGSVPSSDGSTSTSGPGSLLVINAKGKLVSTIADSDINGPWDMTIVDNGKNATLFVSNVFPGNVVRIELAVSATGVTVTGKRIIASGYEWRPDPVAFVVGPTGLLYDSASGVLYVASTEDNAVYAISAAEVTKANEGKGKLIYHDTAHLHGPLGLAEAPNGHLLVTNSDVINANAKEPSEIVEFTTGGDFVKELSVDPAFGGSFGLATELVSDPDASILAAVDDNTASMIIYNLPP